MVEEVKGIGDSLGELKRETFAKHNAFTVAEVFNMRKEELKEFIGEEGHFSTMFDFAALDTMAGGHGWYDAPEYDFFKWRTALFNAQEKYQGEVFLANIIENHDEPRGASTYLPAYAQNDEGTKMLATTSILLWGLPFLYQGQEIGMTNCRMKDIAEYDDIDTKNQYRIAMEAGLSQEEALQLCFKHSRDNARTPMQWSGEANAGFSTGSPWLKVNPNYVEKNVEAEENDASSVLSYYKKLLSLRKAEGYREVFTYGDFRPDFEKEGMVFAYHRSNEEQDILIAANFGLQEVKLELGRCGEILLKNQEGVGLEDKRLTLPSCGVAVVDL